MIVFTFICGVAVGALVMLGVLAAIATRGVSWLVKGR